MHALALGAGRIQERLEDAAGGIAKAAGSTRDMTPEFRAKYDSTVARLSAVAPQGGEGAFHATIKSMSDEEACALASQILDLAYMAKEAYEAEPVMGERG